MRALFCLIPALLWAETASALPDGGFLLATPILDNQTTDPRYIHLQIDGTTITVTYASVKTPDVTTCRDTGYCDMLWDGLKLRYSEKDGTIKITDRNVTRDDKPSDANRKSGDPTADQKLYYEPLIRRMNGAKLTGDAAGGFTLTTDLGQTKFTPLPREGLPLLTAWVNETGADMDQLDYCDVPQFSQLYTFDAGRSFREALEVFAALQASEAAANRMGLMEPPDEASNRETLGSAFEARRPATILEMAMWRLTIEPETPLQDIIEDISRQIGTPESMAVVTPLIPALPAAAAYKAKLRAIRDAGTPLNAPLCMDMTLGLRQ
ncbi:hypothetical protein [Thioclava sp. GXIMD4216]|uniref:hypothetical protein n=1 Tax=Thioclava sp. GXIMD4216 TaxID=3131929 RepID=UPI0030D618F4